MIFNTELQTECQLGLKIKENIGFHETYMHAKSEVNIGNWYIYDK